MRRRQECRRGLGILLVIAVTFCVVLFVAGIAQLLFSGQVFGQAARGAGGMTAEYLAESAVEELLLAFQAGVNDPESAIFEEVRRCLLLREPREVHLTEKLAATRLGEIMKASANSGFYENFELAGHRVVLRSVPETDRRDVQTLEVAADVRLEMGRRSETRRVRVEHAVGITRIGPRRPLDQVPFAIVRTRFIGELRHVLEGIRRALEAYGQVREGLETWKAVVEAKLPQEEIEADVPPMRIGGSGTDGGRVRLPAGQTYRFRQGWSSIPPVAEPRLPPDDSILFARPEETVELADFDYYLRLESAVEPLRRRLEQVLLQFGAAMRPMEAAVGAGVLRSGPHSAWASGMRNVGGSLRELLTELRAAAFELAEHVAAHSLEGATSEMAELPRHYASNVPLLPLTYHMPSPSAARALLSTWPAVSGHMAVYNGEGPGGEGREDLMRLTLHGFAGRLIVSRESGLGNIEVGAIGVENPARDMLMVEADELRVSGTPIQAVLVARKALETISSSEIEGAVIVQRYDRPEPGSRRQWEGKVSYGPLVATGSWTGPKEMSGLVLGSYVVGLAPQVIDRTVTWNP